MFVLYFYWSLLQDHGTFAPWFAWYYTAQGPYIPPRPANYRPSTRFVVSLTTMPGDVEHLDEVLMSLSNQTIQPAAIYVNLPKKNRRTGAPYVIPDWLPRFPNVYILQPDTDYGPMTKLYPSLEKETDPETIIISVDDDKVYAPKVLEHLMYHAETYPDAVWGICGWGFMWVPEPQGVISVYVPWYMRLNYGRFVDVTQGVCGVAYRRKFFPDLPRYSKPHPDCFLTDDMWTSSNVGLVAKKPRLLTSGPLLGFWELEPKDTKWLKKSRQHRLSDTNRVIDKDYRCVRGASELLGDWSAIPARAQRPKA